MSGYYEPSDSSFDERLRRVRVPRGLVARLRAIAVASDNDIDGALAGVPVPDGLVARLREIPELSTVELDLRLNDIPLPTGLLAGLRQIGSDATSDAELDYALRDVAVPERLVWRTRRASHEAERRRRRVREFVLAASLFLAVGLSYLGAVTGFVMTAFGVGTATPKPVLSVDPQQTIARSRDTAAFELEPAVAAATPSTFVPLAEAEFRPAPPTIAAAPQPTEPPILAPAIDWYITGSAYDLLVDVAQAKWGKFLAYELGGEETEAPLEVGGPRPGGLAPIFAKGYDARIHAKHGVHPYVSTSNPRFRRSQPPLTSSTLSYENARRDLFSRRRLDREAIRIEEFLAAPDYALPKLRPGEVRVHMAGGKSPFASRPRLLQVAVNVGDVVNDVRRPVHLIVAVDVSASMSADGRLERVQTALERLVDRMDKTDRISVIGFSDDATIVTEQLQRRDRRNLVEAVGSLAAGGTTNLGAGLQLAYSVAHTPLPTDSYDRRIVVVGDGRTGLAPSAQSRIASLLSTAAAEDIAVQFIDHRPRASVAAPIAALVRSGGCSAVAAATVQELDWALAKSLTGRAQVVLPEAKLDVQFNPAVVKRWRLVGHGAQLLPGNQATDLRAGQVAVALYEVETKEDVHGWVARAQVAWRDAVTSRPRSTPRVSIARSELDTGFTATVPSFQLAVIAAQVGEALKGSPYVGVATKQALARAHDAVRRLDTEIRERPRNRQMIEFMGQLRRVRTW